VVHQGETMNGRSALLRAGLNRWNLEAKEGLALLNGTAFMVGMGALQCAPRHQPGPHRRHAAAMTLEALHGTDRAYDERVHRVRPHPARLSAPPFCAATLAGSQLLRRADPLNVQDPYTLRCVPQVHGAVRDAIAYAQWVIGIELNAVNDNPIIFVDERNGGGGRDFGR
jgi:histidine ammonia-lyase